MGYLPLPTSQGSSCPNPFFTRYFFPTLRDMHAYSAIVCQSAFPLRLALTRPVPACSPTTPFARSMPKEAAPLDGYLAEPVEEADAKALLAGGFEAAAKLLPELSTSLPVEVVLLGTAQDGGVPHMACNCVNCSAVKSGVGIVSSVITHHRLSNHSRLARPS